MYVHTYIMRPRQLTKQPEIKGWPDVYIFALLIASIAAAASASVINSAWGNASSMFARSSHDAPTATLSCGLEIYGKTHKEASSSSPSLDEFLGVPFAEPPVGDLRFRAPKPYKVKCSTAIDATNTAKFCPQPGTLSWSEDCLYLNIYRPTSSRDATDLPVAIDIHGGAFHYGSESLVANSAGPFIAVTFEYRLSAFGFLSSQVAAEDGALNVGLLDQVLLFTWIRDNISKFGGNPQRVTALGASAGAHSIGHLLLNQTSERPYFQQAFLEDGAATARSTLPYNSGRTETQFSEFVTQSGCGDVSRDEIMACLREQNSDTIWNASNAVFSKYEKSNRWAFQPVVGGPLIENAPFKSWKSDHLYKIPILTGFTTDEGTSFSSKISNDDQHLNGFMKNLIPAMTDKDLAEMDKLYPLNAYSSGLYRLAAAYGHFAYSCAVRETARHATRKGFDSVYVWHWATNVSVAGGASHVASTPYEVFDKSVTAVSPTQRKIAGYFHSYITSFITMGNPNSLRTGEWAHRPVWQTYAAGRPDGVMIFGENNDERAGGHSLGTVARNTGDDWGEKQCDFWERLRPLSEGEKSIQVPLGYSKDEQSTLKMGEVGG